MAKMMALLLLALSTTADATLGEFLKTKTKGKTTSSFGFEDVCKSMKKTYNGYSWSAGGGSTTIDITCSGEKISIVCPGYPTFTGACTSASADGKQGDGCTCAASHPDCKSNGWCKSKAGEWSYAHCPGTCTASAEAQATCSCPAAYPFCYSKDKWCYESKTSNSYTSQCGGECSDAKGLPAAEEEEKEEEEEEEEGCTCPSAYPYCWEQQQWCYKSASSDSYTEKCAGKCTASAPAAKPAPGSAKKPAPTPAPTSGGSGEQIAEVKSCGGQLELNQQQAQEMLDLHNKFRCAVGTPPLKWNGPLQCQAQKEAENLQGFHHSKSYSLPIPAGENLAGGIDVSQSAWMWFAEYTQRGYGMDGHFTAMTWRGVTELGCGIWKGGTYGGNIRCQYAAGIPNMQGEYDANVPVFKGEKAKFEKCGLTIAEVRQHIKKFSGWGNIVPNAGLSASLGLFADESVAWSTASSSMVTIGVAFAAAALALMGMVLGMRRWQHHEPTQATDVEEVLTLTPLE
jgi:uncharacterized protein YkwD